MDNWPFPPFFTNAPEETEHFPLDAMLFLRNGKTCMGHLKHFSPLTLTLQFSSIGEDKARAVLFADIKSLHLIQPITLVIDAELIGKYEQAGGKAVHPVVRPFTVLFNDGDHLAGQTRGYVKPRNGLFIFLTTTEQRVVRIFVPETALKSYQVGPLLGQQLIASNAVSHGDVSKALEEQVDRLQMCMNAHLGDQQGGNGTVNLGNILMTQGLVSRDQLFRALIRLKQEKTNMLGHILVEMGALTHSRLTQAVADQLGIPLVSLRDFTVAPSVVSMVPKAYAFEHHVLPLLITDTMLIVAVESPVDADYLQELHLATARQVVLVMANAEELSNRIAIEYARQPMVNDVPSIDRELEQLTEQLGNGTSTDGKFSAKHQVTNTDTLLVRLVNKIVLDAHNQGASDIHIEAYPDEQPTRIRFRIDGVLSDYLKLPHTLRPALVSRLKIMADLDISEHRKPQDGKIDFARFAPLKLELRVAILPTNNGLEDIVMRVLASADPIPLSELGLSSELSVQLSAMAHRSYGLILVCGPTGSGKTTTLHTLLEEVNTAENKIWTAEDPIEISHPGLRQIQMLPRAGLTFATAMRAFLRADPDIIMVGEMRDSETSHIAVEASLTGHLVLSTLHTNSAPESVVRLLDMGLDPFSFSDALIGVLSQRLARKLCSHCKSQIENAMPIIEAMAHEYCEGTELQVDQVLSDWMVRYAGSDVSTPVLYRATGCAKCNQTGHKGRIGIYELMVASPGIKKLIQSRAPAHQLFEMAVHDGMLTLKQYGLLKVMDGLTDQISVHIACS